VEQTVSQIAQQGMDVKKVFTPDVVRGLMDTSRPEAEKRLRRGLALQALATAEAIEVDPEELASRLAEVRGELGDRANIDDERLLLAVRDDLLQERLLSWLEANSTISETTEPAPATTPTPATAPEKVADKPSKAKTAKKAEPAAESPQATTKTKKPSVPID
jgi:trigger factor